MTKTAAVIGAGPAGLMAAQVLSAAGMAVTVYDRMPSVGRKFLMAGRGGLNLTHSEDFERFVTRYRAAAPVLRPPVPLAQVRRPVYRSAVGAWRRYEPWLGPLKDALAQD